MNRRALILGAFAAPLAAVTPAPSAPINLTLKGVAMTPIEVRATLGLPTFAGGGWTPLVTGEAGAELVLPLRQGGQP